MFIVDRTALDITEAKRIIEEKVKNFQELSKSEQEIIEKGVFTLNGLNRIESAESELKRQLNSMGYWGIDCKNNEWSQSSVFKQKDLDLIFENCQNIKKGFFSYHDTPDAPSARFHYSNINDLEKILSDISDMINDVKNNYLQCGNVSCGEYI